MILDFFRIALGNLRRRKLRSWLTMAGIIIGITAVVSLIGMGEGLKYAITSQFGGLGTDKLTVTTSGGLGPPGTGVIKPLTKANLEKISRINGVKLAAGRLVRAGKLEYNSRVGFGYAASMPDGEARTVVEEAMNLKASDGRLLKDGDTGKVILGNNFATQETGFGKFITAGSRVAINDRQFEVVGILKKTGGFLVDNMVLMNEQDMRTALGINNEDLDIIVLQVDNNADMKAVQANVEKLMRRERDVKLGEEDFTVQTPQAILDQVSSTLFAVQVFVYIIAGISIVVGGIGIMNTMFTSVLERRREIGIMKSIGATNQAIFTLFFIESGLIGAIGGIAGALGGLGLANGLAFVGRIFLGSDILQAHITPLLLISAVFGSFFLGSVFGIIPALRAAHLHPVEALQKK
jgi:putative ABC transport system permease protein